MSTTDFAHTSAEQPIFTSRNLLDYVPGVLLLIGIGLLGKYGLNTNFRELARTGW